MKAASFENSVDVLVRAYMNDTLVHGNCYACAVGNLVAAANGWTYTKCVDLPGKQVALAVNGGRYMGRDTVGGDWMSPVEAKNWNEVIKITAKEQAEIESTGYTFEQIAEIENAFENAPCNPDRMFNGLLAVVNVLAKIHSVDLSTKETAVSRFHSVQESKEI